MRQAFHSNFDDDGNLTLTSPCHKEVRLNENGVSGRIDLKSHLTKVMMDDKHSESADESDHYKQNRVVKERFYEFYKRIQGCDAKYYFNGIRKNLIAKVDGIYSPEELSENFEKVYKKSTANLKSAKKLWTDEENAFLISLVTYYTQINDEDFNAISDSGWKYISELFPVKKQDQLKTKWQSLLKTTVAKVPWSTTEDELLAQIISEKGNKRQWKEIANELNSRSGSDVFRHGKQCRERWINHLDPDMNRGAWTVEEDVKLLQSFIQVGKKWAEIAKRVGQRTENSVKNRWNSLMKKHKNEIGMESVADGFEENDKELSSQKKIAQLVLESMGRDKGNSPLLIQTSSVGSNRTQSTEKSNISLPKQSMMSEQTSLVKETVKQEPLMGFLDQSNMNNQQQLHAALLAQMNNGLNHNFGNQSLFLNQLSMSPLGRNQFPGHFSGVGTPQNQLQQSPKFDSYLPNWQNLPGVTGMSPMNQSLGGYSPMSNFGAFVGFQGLPNFQNVSNMQQILQNQNAMNNSSTPTSNSGDLFNGLKSQTPSSFAPGRTFSSQLGVIRESHQEDKQNESVIESQVNGTDMFLKEKPFEDFTENLIETHNLQFAVVDLTKKELFYITNVTKDNYGASLTTMKGKENNYWSLFQPTSLDLTSLNANNPFGGSAMSLSNVNNINSLNQDMANLIITPKPASRKENDPTSSPSLMNLIPMGRFSQESDGLFSSKEIDQGTDAYPGSKSETFRQQMLIKESENEDMSVESLKNLGDSIAGL